MKSLHEDHVSEDISKVLLYIKEKNLYTIKPSFDTNVGVYYNDLKGFSIHEQLHILTILKNEGIATEELSGSVLQCSSCNSFGFCTSYVCSSCGSTNIKKGRVIRHMPCNNIDFDHKYLTDKGDLVCEKCNVKLKAIGVDYSRQGDFFECQKCNAMTPRMDMRYTCIRCDKHHMEEDLKVLQSVAYVIDPAKLSTFAKESDYLLSISEELMNKGIMSVYQDSVLGKSMVQHSFALVVYKGAPAKHDSTSPHYSAPLAVVDIVDHGTINNNTLLGMIGKCIDVSAINKILVSIPKLDGAARLMASTYGISVIEAETRQEAKSKLIHVISRIMGDSGSGVAMEQGTPTIDSRIQS